MTATRLCAMLLLVYAKPVFTEYSLLISEQWVYSIDHPVQYDPEENFPWNGQQCNPLL